MAVFHFDSTGLLAGKQFLKTAFRLADTQIDDFIIYTGLGKSGYFRRKFSYLVDGEAQIY